MDIEYVYVLVGCISSYLVIIGVFKEEAVALKIRDNYIRSDSLNAIYGNTYTVFKQILEN